MPSVISGDANVSATEFGYLDGVTSALQTQIDSKLPLAGGKILQIVRATDTTQRTTTSTSYVDTGMSVSITPERSDSAIMILASFEFQTFWLTDGDNRGQAVITDVSNVVLPGAQEINLGSVNLTGTGQRTILFPIQMLAWDTPATTSSVSYKLRFKVVNSATTLQFRNSVNVGQMFAIEVSA